MTFGHPLIKHAFLKLQIIYLSVLFHLVVACHPKGGAGSDAMACVCSEGHLGLCLLEPIRLGIALLSLSWAIERWVLQNGLEELRPTQAVGQRQVPLWRIQVVLKLLWPLPAGKTASQHGREIFYQDDIANQDVRALLPHDAGM